MKVLVLFLGILFASPTAQAQGGPAQRQQTLSNTSQVFGSLGFGLLGATFPTVPEESLFKTLAEHGLVRKDDVEWERRDEVGVIRFTRGGAFAGITFFPSQQKPIAEAVVQLLLAKRDDALLVSLGSGDELEVVHRVHLWQMDEWKATRRESIWVSIAGGLHTRSAVSVLWEKK